MTIFNLTAGKLSLADIRRISQEKTTLQLTENDRQNIQRSNATLNNLLASNKTYYGINTGFGAMATTRIPPEQILELQKNLVLSHAAGTGAYLHDEVVKLILLLKINSLARGYSGIRQEVIDALIQLFNHEIYPCIPGKGSVGASGDLAPLAHLSCVLLGEGFAHHQGKIISGMEALQRAQLPIITLQAKEGLDLLNGTQVSTAIALQALIYTERLLSAAVIAGALAVDGAAGSDVPFYPEIHAIRGHAFQIKTAEMLFQLLQGSQIRSSHANCSRVQDPYCLRCQPQILGACWDQAQHAAMTLEIEANAVSDNPLIFSDTQSILSGGNFHAEPVAFAADNLALALAEMGSLAERQIAMLTDKQFSGLPAFLVKESGLHSGFMLAHVTAASLVSENKSLAHPASVDSIPTSANQEDHVSMATFAARRLLTMIENTATIIGINLLAGAQAIELRQPLLTSPQCQAVIAKIRSHVPFYEKDRYFAPDIAIMKQLVLSGKLG
jgi:histidine ammonia-lyase